MNSKNDLFFMVDDFCRQQQDQGVPYQEVIEALEEYALVMRDLEDDEERFTK